LLELKIYCSPEKNIRFLSKNEKKVVIYMRKCQLSINEEKNNETENEWD
jgi:hypothetical protein